MHTQQCLEAAKASGSLYHHDGAICEKRRQDLGDGVHDDLEAVDAADNLDETQHSQHQQHVQRQATLLLWVFRENSVASCRLVLFSLNT